MTFFTDLGIVILVVSIVGLLFSYFKLPLTVGYILAGIIVGPHCGPKLITDPNNIQMLSDLGVMFLMFAIGLGFSFKQLRSQGVAAAMPALWDVIFMIVGGYLMGCMLGWKPLECFLLGLILCNSSTSIAAKTLEELGLLKERFASNAFAIAVIEDVLSIMLIAILYGVGQAGEGGAWWPTVVAIAKQMGVLLLFLVGVIVLGLPLIPRVMNNVASRFGNELVLMSALGFCFGVSLLANSLKLSLVVGAFLAGTILSYVNARERLLRTVKPVSQLFAAVFFVSVGLLVEPGAIWNHLSVILFITFGMIVLKCVNGVVASILVGERPTDAFRTGLALGQIAEFAFIIATIGATLEMTRLPLFQISVGVALLCTATNPYLLRLAPKMCTRCRKAMPQGMRKSLMAYRATILKMRQRGRQATRATKLRMEFFLLAIDLCVVFIFSMLIYFISTIPVVEHLLLQADARFQILPWPIPWGGLICVASLIVLSAMPLWASFQHLLCMTNEVVAAIDDMFPTRSENAYVRDVVSHVLHVIVVVGLTAFILLISVPFIANVWILIPFLVLCMMVASRFTPHIASSYKHHHQQLRRAFDIEEPDADDVVDRQSVRNIIDLQTELFIMPKASCFCGKTLSEINLRQQTGASLISIYTRGNDSQIAPGGDTVINAGDCLVVCGNDEQVAHAMDFLSRERMG
jgi:CPA2 family monovalent cation:H+ antiporter-2